jgi:Holliday junction resolvase
VELLHQALLLALVLLLVLLGAWLATKWRVLRERKKARGAAKRGLQGERDAEKLIKQLGYKIVLRHPPATYAMAVDGDPQGVQLTADFLLEQKGKRVLAEVKTGKAAKLEHAETRRQLLEYQLAFGVDALLLIDMDAKQVRTVRFPLPKAKSQLVAPLAPVAAKAVTAVRKRATVRWTAIALCALFATWAIFNVARRDGESQGGKAPQGHAK